MKLLPVVLMALAQGLASRAQAGTIVGHVRAEGKAGADTASSAGGGAYESRQYKFLERIRYEDWHDFLVFIEGDAGGHYKPPAQPASIVTERIVQKGATFSPHILPVLVGTEVEWPNYDKILHNVFSFSEAKQFDLGLYKTKKGEPIPKIKFDKPGRVDVFCSIHSRMSCVVYVLENPYFSMTNDRGYYSITNVPPGSYTLKAWHERLPPMEMKIQVPETGEVKADFILGIKNLPKPQ